MKISQVTQFAMYRVVSSYEQLKKAIQEYDSRIRSFYYCTGQEGVINQKLIKDKDEKDKKLLVRLYVRVKNMEDKIDTFGNQLVDVTL